jgi:hypothetical protein
MGMSAGTLRVQGRACYSGVTIACKPRWRLFARSLQVGPVAQLGARFHGMEEVKGSNPFRSTNLRVSFPHNSRTLVQPIAQQPLLEPNHSLLPAV